MKVEIDESSSRIRVESNERIIIELSEFPTAELKNQLREWVCMVDDKRATSFIFRPFHPELLGTFRIVSRPERWQFTSCKERFRSTELLSLNEWKDVLRRAGV